jgi:hypothetical protein
VAGYAASWTTEGISGETTVTEAEWLASDDPRPMLDILHGREHDRKRRLFAAASSRRVAHLLPETAGEAIAAAEAFADGRIDKAKLNEVFKAADAAARKARSDRGAHFVVRDVARLSARHSCWYVAWAAAELRDIPDGREGEWKRQAALLRDILGNPFRPVSISSTVLTWNDAVVVRLAQAAYEERQLPAGTLDNGRLAVLADALEEAGCTDAEVLGHLLGPGPHVHGCWAVDLCLGKS